jgi:hypothetical protein
MFGNTPGEALAGLMEFLKETAAKLDRPAPSLAFEPATLRDIAAIQEAVIIEKEIRKGAEGNATVVARAGLLRRDIWDRWRAGQGIVPVHTPLTDAIGKLADVADRQFQLMASGRQLVATHNAIPATPQLEPPVAVEVCSLPAQPDADISSAPLFSQLEDKYVALREAGGAGRGAVSTIRARVQVFKELAGDRPLDGYKPIDMQN